MSSSIYLTPAADIDALITQLAGRSLTGQYTVTSGPTPTVGGDDTPRNTKLSITMNSGGTLKGTKVFYYDRLDLAALAHFSYYQVRGFVSGESINSQLSLIRDMTGIVFATTDLVSQNVTDNGAGVATVPLEAESTSLGFINSVNLTAVTLLPLSTVFSTGTLSGF